MNPQYYRKEALETIARHVIEKSDVPCSMRPRPFLWKPSWRWSTG
jgi:hypothetical protein